MDSALLHPAVMGVIATLIVLQLMRQGRRVMLHICTIIAVPAFLGGLLLYSIGYMPEGGVFAQATTAMLRGLFSTGRMFLINDDYGFLMDDPQKIWLTGSLFFQIPFWLCHTLALVVSGSAIMSLFGQRAFDVLRLRTRSYRVCTIIFGKDEKALVLGNNILTRDGDHTRPDRRQLVVCMAANFSDDEREALAGVGIISIAYKAKGLAHYLRRCGVSRGIRIRRVRAVFMSMDHGESMEQLKGTIAYAAGNRVSAEKLSLYVLSENPAVLDFVQKQRDELAASKPEFSYCVRVMSEADLAARNMIRELMPCESVANFGEGFAREAFNVMVIGFGKTGVHALNRLVLNGQFTLADGSAPKMTAIVVDKNLDRLFPGYSILYPELKECCTMDEWAVDGFSSDFFRKLTTCTRNIHYVVLALNDDEATFTLLPLLQKAFNSKGQKHKPYFALALNSGHGAGSIKSNGNKGDNIYFFSQTEKIYTQAIVIDDATDHMAIAINDFYSKDDTESALVKWLKLDSFLQESNRASADFIPSMLYLAGLKEDTIHEGSMPDEDDPLTEALAHTEHLRWNAFHYAHAFTTMPLTEVEARIKSGITPIRKDMEALRHACLVPWEALPEVSRVVGLLTGGPSPNYQQTDRNNVLQIPRTLAYYDLLKA